MYLQDNNLQLCIYIKFYSDYHYENKLNTSEKNIKTNKIYFDFQWH